LGGQQHQKGEFSVDTIETLKQRLDIILKNSEASVCRYPEEYKQLKTLLARVLNGSVDVSEYFDLACRLTKLIQTLTQEGKENIFDHYCQDMDPRKEGTARYFRFLCLDLYNRILELDRFRKSCRKLHVVQ